MRRSHRGGRSVPLRSGTCLSITDAPLAGSHVNLGTHHQVGSLLGVLSTMNAMSLPLPPAELFAGVFVLRAI